MMAFPNVLNTSTLTGSTGFKITSVDSSFGVSVAGVGDVNGDGRPDFAIGADVAKTAYVVFGKSGSFTSPIDTSTLTGSTGFKITSVDTYFGISAAGVGDVNADGRPDFVVGADGAKTAYVVFGKSGSFISPIDTSTLTGSTGFKITSVDASFGCSVAVVGDVNGDGRPDFAIGAYSAKTAYVVFGKSGSFISPVDTSTLTGSTGFKITSSDLYFGYPVAGVGDVNGDGRPDFAIGAYGANTAYVVFGKSGSFISPIDTSTLTGSTGFKITSSDLYFGARVAGLGDVNGDGRPDFAIGAYNAKTAYVVFGKSGSFISPIDTSTLTGSTGFKITSVDSGFGNSVAGLGDVNGDGKPDFAIGANGANTAYVVFGKSGSFISPVDTSTLTGSTGFKITSVDSFGYSVAGVGDVNGDGRPDFAIGASGANTAYVVFGQGTATESHSHTRSVSRTITRTSTHSPSLTITKSDTHVVTRSLSHKQTPTTSFSPTPAYTATSSVRLSKTSTQAKINTIRKPIIDLRSTEPNVIKISGANDADAIGYFVTGIGDINLDGRGDILITTSKINKTSTLDASSCITQGYVVYGQSSRASFPLSIAAINLSTGFVIPNIQGFIYGGNESDWQTQCYAIGAKAGDINKDGVDDFIVGTPHTATAEGMLDIGAAYVVFGKSTGFGSSLDLATLNGTNGFKVTAEPLHMATDSTYFESVFPIGTKRGSTKSFSISTRNIGYSVGSGGDVNADGFTDIVLGDPNSGAAGEVSVIFGESSFGPLVHADFLASGGINIQGNRAHGIGRVVNSASDINGDGIADIATTNAPNGLALVILGQSGFSSYNVTSINGISSFEVIGASIGSRTSIATADINGDGKGDVVIGAPDLNHVYIVFGATSFSPQFNISSLNGTNGITIDGTDPTKKLGVSIATGNINGDRFADLIIAESDSACVSGSAYVIFGRSDFSAHHPFDLATLDGVSGYKIINIPGCDYLGFTVSSGDVDGNGRDDVLIGSGARTDGADAWIVLS